ENVSTVGLTEEQLCIGDVLQLGEAVVQISQGRQPCWKLSAHTEREDMAAQFQKSRRTGWYYRVLQEGYVEAGAPVALAERPQPEWPLPVVIAARFDPKLDPAEAGRLAMIEELSTSWREGFRRKSVSGDVEDTAPRLAGTRRWQRLTAADAGTSRASQGRRRTVRGNRRQQRLDFGLHHLEVLAARHDRDDLVARDVRLGVGAPVPAPVEQGKSIADRIGVVD